MLNFVMDVDGVLTNGKFFYTSEGKVMKEFGPDDSDALRLLSKYANIYFMSQDQRGMAITRKRVEDMGFKVIEIPSRERAKYISDNFGSENTVYMGDSFLDVKVCKSCKWSICPANSSPLLKPNVTYVTEAEGGNRAVAEAVFWIIQFILKMNIGKILEES